MVGMIALVVCVSLGLVACGVDFAFGLCSGVVIGD